MLSAPLVSCVLVAACGGGEVATDGPGEIQPLQAARSQLKNSTPPTISITSPMSIETNGVAVVTGVASDDGGVKAVSWVNSLGGSGVATLDGKVNARTWTVASLQLHAGDNALTFTATDFSGNTSSTQILLTFAPPAPELSPPPVPDGPPIPPPKPNVVHVAVLDGSGVPGAYARGCEPVIAADFVDTGSWSTRRLEPRDCAIVKVATPVFAWKQPSDRDLAVPWTLTLRTADGSLIASRSAQSPRLLLAETPLLPGNYSWTVSYRNKSGSSITSASRRFTVAAESVGAVLPSAESIATLAARKSRPRALPASASFVDIAAAARGGEYSVAFDTYMKAAADYRAEAPPAPPTESSRAEFASDLDYNNWKKKLRDAASKEWQAIEVLGYAAQFSGDSSYAVAGIARLVNLAAWPTRGATSEETQDQANRNIYVGLALGLDLYASRLSPSQTSAVVASLKDRLLQVMGKFPTLDSSPYDPHLVNSSRYVTTALLHAVGTPGFDEAQDWLRQAWDTWVTTQDTWGADGEFANAPAYGWYNGITLAQTVANVRLITNTDLSRWPAVANFGKNHIAFTAPAIKQISAFGDDREYDYMFTSYSPDYYRLYAGLTRAPQDEWYWRSLASNINLAKALPVQHYLLLGLKQPPVTPAAPTANSWVLEDAGLVAMHSSTADAYRSSLYFRSSRFGSFNHSTADNNAFTFVSKGMPLFISGGYYPYYNSPHHALVGRATRYKNALTFNGGIGQAEPTGTPTSPGAPAWSMDARGQLINFHDNGVWAVTTGDATLAYRGQDPVSKAWTPLLESAVRSVAYNRSAKVAVIYDWATSGAARIWELNFQMLNAPTLSGSTLRAVNGSALGCVDVYNTPGAFNLTSGFPIAPENGATTQYQARYTAAGASTQLVALTVIREDCRSVPISVTVAGTAASISIDGAPPLTLDRKMVTVPAP